MAPNSGLPPITDRDAMPANHLLVELRTRITTQRLHYRSGDEETAAESVHQLFPTTRKLLAENPQASAFRTVALHLLNEVVRPYTARWHRWMVDERFTDERARRQFRTELRELQPRLQQFANLLEHLIEGKQADADQVFAIIVTGPPPPLVPTPPDQVADLGGEVDAGIDPAAVPPAPGPGPFAAVSDINRAERAFIHRRRRALDLKVPQNPADDENQPVVDATGLCLSGGGIRSATFCLGIVQVLARRGMLHQIDYLSTVSGGGYLGSFLTSYLGSRDLEAVPANAAVTGEEIRQTIDEAFNSGDGRDSAAVRHLRNNSRYLLNGGLGRLRAFGLVVSGILTNLLLVLPVPLLAVLVVAGLAFLGFWGSWPKHPANESLADWRSWPASTVLTWGAILAGGAWLLLPIVQNSTRGAVPRSIPSKIRTAWESATIVLALFTIAAAALLILPWLFEAVGALGRGGAALVAMTPIVFGLLAARLKAGLAKKVATGLFTLSGPLFCLLVLLFVGSYALSDPRILSYVIWATLVLAFWGWLCVDINTFSPHGFYRNRLCECYLAARRSSDEASFVRGLMQKGVHGRKAEETAKVTGVGTLRQLPLSQINETHAAPYHLINTAVNLPASREPNLRGRDCDFYLFSRYYCGGPVCGYVKTETIEELDPHVDLGTAMAVSGAAASVNMGVRSLRQFRFLLALLNVRLGYWLRNPKRGRRRFWNVPGPSYMFYEVTGWMHESRAYLNLSDGGHIENLALYELLRRRCKFIIVVDGGMEPAMELADLRLAQRYAEIDLGVRFDLDIADLALDASRRSRAYAIFGKIQYSKKELGWLIYLKLACTGEEPGYVVDYRRQNPDFPHQTTGDQVYDEAQFEAYRRLGECAAESLFREELTGERNVETIQIRDWFQCLADNLLPDNDPAVSRRSTPA